MRPRAAGVILVALTALLLTGTVGCTSSGPSASLTVTPNRELYDQPFAASITGLTAGAAVTLALSTTSADGTLWRSSAAYRASRAGRVTTSQAPSGGSYFQADPMGLVATLTPPPGASQTFVAKVPWTMTLTAAQGHTTIGTVTLHRLEPADEGVRPTPTDSASSGVVGELYLPKAKTPPRPGVVVFGGSEGGLDTQPEAALLAAHGYPSLALAYFHAPGLPDNLERIPLEYFAKAVRLLDAQSGVDRQRIVLWGTSRGSEAALLTAADFPDLVDGVVASVPSSVVNGGLPDSDVSAWSLHGRAVPAEPRVDLGDPAPANAPQSVIPVEKVRGPLFLVCGQDDQVWASCPYAQAIAARLSRLEPAAKPTVLSYPLAGHFVGSLVPYYPSVVLSGATASGLPLQSGGTLDGNAMGRAQAWPRLLTWLSALPAS